MTDKRKLVHTLLSYEWNVTAMRYGIFDVSEVTAGPFLITVEYSRHSSITGFLIERDGVVVAINSIRLRRRVARIHRGIQREWSRRTRAEERAEKRSERLATRSALKRITSMD